LGDVVPPASEQPPIVEAELGVREYWYETFRRVLVIPDGDGCFLLSVDVYTPLRGEEWREGGRLEAAGVVLHYLQLAGSGLALGGNVPEAAEAAVVEAGGRRELGNVRLRYCGLAAPPSYDDVYRVYRRLVTALEGRDPATSPLQAPEPSPRVYASRAPRARKRRPRR